MNRAFNSKEYIEVFSSVIMEQWNGNQLRFTRTGLVGETDSAGNLRTTEAILKELVTEFSKRRDEANGVIGAEDFVTSMQNAINSAEYLLNYAAEDLSQYKVASYRTVDGNDKGVAIHYIFGSDMCIQFALELAKLYDDEKKKAASGTGGSTSSTGANTGGTSGSTSGTGANNGGSTSGTGANNGGSTSGTGANTGGTTSSTGANNSSKKTGSKATGSKATKKEPSVVVRAVRTVGKKVGDAFTLSKKGNDDALDEFSSEE